MHPHLRPLQTLVDSILEIGPASTAARYLQMDDQLPTVELPVLEEP